jgi:hypothetical protein
MERVDHPKLYRIMFAARNMTFARPVAGGGGSFDPLSLSPALWLSDTGSDPSVWSDLSGNARHAVQATSGNQPSIVTGVINGRQVRRFDGVNDFLVSPLVVHGLTLTTFAVSKITANTDIGAIFSSGRGGGDPAPLEAALRNAFVSGTNAYRSTPSGTSRVNGGTTLTLAASPSPFYITSTVHTAAVNITSGSNTTHVGVVLNSSGVPAFLLNGDIAEIIIYPTALGTTDRQAVESYLSAEYAITLV